MPKQLSFAIAEQSPCRNICRNAAGVGGSPKGLARAIVGVLDVAAEPLTIQQIVSALRGRFRAFSIVSMVERMDDFNRLTVLRLARLSTPDRQVLGFTLPKKLPAFRRAGRLGEIRIWTVPDLRATLDDINDY